MFWQFYFAAVITNAASTGVNLKTVGTRETMSATMTTLATMSPTKSATNLDHCTNGFHKCNLTTSTCINTTQSYMCVCQLGYSDDWGNGSCVQSGKDQKKAGRTIWVNLLSCAPVILLLQLITNCFITLHVAVLIVMIEGILGIYKPTEANSIASGSVCGG